MVRLEHSLKTCGAQARLAPMRNAFFALLLSLAVNASSALTKQERREFLDAIRPIAAMKAGQPIRFKVLNLNIDSGWAVLFGELMGEEGRAMDWSKAKGCDENLDKLLWVVAQRHGQGWRIKEMSVCSPEPPYWSLNPEAAYSLPCGIYAGLKITGSTTAEDECRAHQNKHLIGPDARRGMRP
jgi:hypothetical protein